MQHVYIVAGFVTPSVKTSRCLLEAMLNLILLVAILSGTKGNLYNQNSYTVTVERVILTYFNPYFFKTVHCNNTKFNRTTNTAIIAFENIKDIVDFKGTLQAYMYLSNEYKLFPLRFSVDFCKSMERNYYGLHKFLTLGNLTGCPIKSGSYYVKDYTIDYTKFPPNIPTGRYKINCATTSSSKRFVDTEVFMDVKEILQNRRKHKQIS